MEDIKRKGARRTADIPVDIRSQLNQGLLETANLVEWLAVDQQFLLENLLQQEDRLIYLEPVLASIDQLKKRTVNTVNEAIGTTLFEEVSKAGDLSFLPILARHRSDLVRCWASYAIGKNRALSLADSLAQIQPFAADKHFGVREICWMVLRPKIAEQLEEAIAILAGWTSHVDENIRRFATESTRPRGVWCAHIEALKENPSLALPLLEPLKADPAKYVQDSVSNWLNDASKTQAPFVRALCQAWEEESPCKETLYIVKKALRTVGRS